MQRLLFSPDACHSNDRAPTFPFLRHHLREGGAADLARLGAEPGQVSRAAFAQMVSEEWERWGMVVRAAGIRSE